MLRLWSPVLVPGLLQTAGYASRAFSPNGPWCVPRARPFAHVVPWRAQSARIAAFSSSGVLPDGQLLLDLPAATGATRPQCP